MPDSTRSPRGFVLIDKPSGWTSHDVVGWLRARLRVRRIGHAGTLDPLATGLLPCLVGPSTRLVRFLHGWPKSYVGVIALGLETPTDDAEGVDPSQRPPVAMPPRLVLEEARRRFTGVIEQTPPAYSAKKLRGTPAHKIARRGGEPVLLAQRVTVHAWRLVPLDAGRLAFAARVSAGTYIRSLARDLGRFLGTGAHLERLRRTAIGPLRVRGAIDPSLYSSTSEIPLGPPAVTPDSELPLPLPTVSLDAEAASAFCAGRAVRCATGLAGEIRVQDGRGPLLGVGLATPDGLLRPSTVLPGLDDEAS